MPGALAMPPHRRGQHEPVVQRLAAQQQQQQPSVAINGDSIDRETVEFDVYAQPFVPQALKRVNELPGAFEYHTEPSRTTDFVSFVRDYLIPGLLPLLPNPSPPPEPGSPPRFPFRPSLEDYESYFCRHLRLEINAQDREYQSFALYEHHVQARDPLNESDPSQGMAVVIDVPGLRENTPYVEEDDVVQLRPLSKHGMVMSVVDRATGRMTPHRAWTGNVYHGRVESVVRAREKLVVRVDGPLIRDFQTSGAFVEPWIYGGSFNVQFFAPKERTAPMFDVLSHTRNLSSDSSQWLRQLLFPENDDGRLQVDLNRHALELPIFNLDLNYEQVEAVRAVCSQQHGNVPYLISGPPGTGKTMTLIETARQLVRRRNVKHILMCSPSDPAADILVQRLAPYFRTDELLRLNRLTRTFAEVSAAVLPFSLVQGTKFGLPPFPQLMNYRIVVTTCRDASMLMYARVTNTDLYAMEYGFRRAIHPQEGDMVPATLHWGGLLLDEAAQATEPEALIPMCVVAPPSETVHPFPVVGTPFVVMAGDQHQLNPRTSLPSSRLRESLFARLFARPFYADHPLARDRAGRVPMFREAMLPIFRPAFTNLARNYRSHPAILAVPSSVFYADTLRAEAADIDRLRDWPGWRRPGWPVLFHSNDSVDDMERDGGGWYNSGEAEIALATAARFRETGGLLPKDICIMSPFQAQVRRLRLLARSDSYDPNLGLGSVNIGPCEAFQGLESGVVILCTTRARADRHLERDSELRRGVVGETAANLINVSLTRAKYGLVVIGNRIVLDTDARWRAFMGFCDRNGLVEGEEDRDDGVDGDGDEDGHEVGHDDGGGDGGQNGGENGNEAVEGMRTRLERLLIARDIGPERLRVLGRDVQEDPMWANAQWEPDDD